jgi:hypothetical protein
MLLIMRIAYLIWSRLKKHVTMDELIRWEGRAYPPGVDPASAALFREHPVLVDVIHDLCHRSVHFPATIGGQSPLGVIHSCLPGVQSGACPSEEALYYEIRKLETSHPYAFRALFGAALAYMGRGWRE